MSEHESSGRRPPEVLINYTEPRIKPPPLLEVGAIAWVRKNLFGSWLDILLTIVGIVIVVGFVVGLIRWVIHEGNWFAIMFSLRTFTIGRLDQALIPRVSVTLLFVMFAIGATTAAYTRRLAPVIPALMAIIAGILLFLPMVINMLIPLPDQILTAGNVGIVSGTAEEVPVERVSFTARAGETISVRIANDAGFDDRLATISGLADRATNTLRNAAANRITTLARGEELLRIMKADVAAVTASEATKKPRSDMMTPNQRALLVDEFVRLQFTVPEDVQADLDEIDAELDDPLLTDSQSEQLIKEKERLLADNAVLTVPPLVTETYNINLQPAQVAIYDAEGTELYAPFPIDPEGVIEFTIPADGWYILEKTIPGDVEAITVLSTQGIYPLFQVGERYLRVVDDFEWRGDPPDDTKWVTLLDNRYRGQRPLDEFLRIYVSPFLDKIRDTVLGSMVALVIGFVLARGLDNQFASLAQPRKASRRLANWLLMATPFVVFLLINGIDMLALISALSWMVGLYWVYHLGTWLYRRFAGQTLLRLIVFGGMIAITFLLVRYTPAFLYNLEPTNSLIAIILAIPTGIVFFMGLVTGSGEAPQVVTQRVTNTGILVAVLYFLPIIIARFLPPEISSAIANVLPYTDSNTWGGLLLSLIVTLYGIIFAFPIGILLALGRRSTLPAIRYPSTFIIETVRGTPFIVVLFAGQFLITFLHPSFQNIPAVYRALASTVIFVAAYLAENVRGGLQAIPGGQYEAGRALGLPEWQIMLYITLPQALRAVIPALVGMFISLFKDTSLLEIVSLSDLSRGVALMVSQNEFREARQEGLIFITIIYFTISYVMAFVSRRIEESGAGSARRI